MAKKECPKCKGEGGYQTTIKHPATCSYVSAHVSCDFPGCHNGIVNLDENRRITSGHIGKCTDCGACIPD